MFISFLDTLNIHCQCLHVLLYVSIFDIKYVGAENGTTGVDKRVPITYLFNLDKIFLIEFLRSFGYKKCFDSKPIIDGTTLHLTLT